MKPYLEEKCPICGEILHAELIDCGMYSTYPPFRCDCGWFQKCCYKNIKDCKKCRQYELCYKELYLKHKTNKRRLKMEVKIYWVDNFRRAGKSGYRCDIKSTPEDSFGFAWFMPVENDKISIDIIGKIRTYAMLGADITFDASAECLMGMHFFE